MRTHYDHRQWMPAHDFFQGVDAVHPWHLQIESDHVGLQLFVLLQAEGAAHRRSHHLNRRVGFQHLRDQLPHQGGIIHHQHAYLAHACPPVALRASRARSAWFTRSPELVRPASCGRIRATCSTTAGRFSMSTTFPSPRIEAPFTRSVEKVWSSKAFMTNSSSPSKASTIRPYFLSPTVITNTNSLLVLRSISAAEGRPRRSRGSTWLRNCKTS